MAREDDIFAQYETVEEPRTGLMQRPRPEPAKQDMFEQYETVEQPKKRDDVFAQYETAEPSIKPIDIQEQVFRTESDTPKRYVNREDDPSIAGSRAFYQQAYGVDKNEAERIRQEHFFEAQGKGIRGAETDIAKLFPVQLIGEAIAESPLMDTRKALKEGYITPFWSGQLKQIEAQQEFTDLVSEIGKTKDIDKFKENMKTSIINIDGINREVSEAQKQAPNRLLRVGQSTIGMMAPVLQSAAKTGFGVIPGISQAEQFNYWQKQGTGSHLYEALKDVDIDKLSKEELEDLINKANRNGSVYAAIEFLSAPAAKALKGTGLPWGKFVKKIADKVTIKPKGKAMRWLFDWMGSTAGEGLEEGLQKFPELDTTNAAREINNSKLPKEERKELIGFIEQLKEASTETIMALPNVALMNLGMGGANILMPASERKKLREEMQDIESDPEVQEAQRQAAVQETIQSGAVEQAPRAGEPTQVELESLTDQQLIDLANMGVDEAVNVPDIQAKGQIINRVNNIRDILKTRADAQKANNVNLTEAQDFVNNEKLEDIANTGTTEVMGVPEAMQDIEEVRRDTEEIERIPRDVREEIQGIGEQEEAPRRPVQEQVPSAEEVARDRVLQEKEQPRALAEERVLEEEVVPRGTVEEVDTQTKAVTDELGLDYQGVQRVKADEEGFISIGDPATKDSPSLRESEATRDNIIKAIDRVRKERIEAGEYNYYKTPKGDIVFEATTQEIADNQGTPITEGRELIAAAEIPTFAQTLKVAEEKAPVKPKLTKEQVDQRSPYFKTIASELGIEFNDVKRGKVEFTDNQTGETIKVDFDANKETIQKELKDIRDKSKNKILLNNITKANKILNSKRLKPSIKYRNDVKKVLKEFPSIAPVLKKDFSMDLLNESEVDQLNTDIEKAFNFIEKSQRDLPILNAQVAKQELTKSLKKEEQKVLRREERIKALKGRQKEVVKEQKEISDYVKKNLPLDARFKADAQIRKLAKAMRGVTAEKYMDHAKRIVDKLSEQRKAKDSVQSIEKLLKKTKPFKKDGVLRGKLDPNANKNLNEIRRVTPLDQETIEKELEEVFNSLEEGTDIREPTPEEIDQIFILQTFGNLKEKSAKQVKAAEKELKEFIGKSRFQQRILEEAKRVERKELRDEFVGVITGGKGEKSLTEKQREEINKTFYQSMKETVRSFDDMNQSFEWMLDKLSRLDKGSKPLESKLNQWAGDIAHKATRAAESGNIKQSDIINKKLQEIYKKKGRALEKALADNGKTLDKNDNTGIFITEKGKRTELLINQNQAYKLWQLYQDPTTWETFDNMGFTHNTFDQIEKYLKPEVKQWAEWQLKEFYPKYYESVNDVYKELFNVDLPFNEFYTPISRDYDGQIEDDPFLEQKSHYGSVMNGHLKTRVASKIPFKLVDGDTTLLSHVNEMEHFKAWALPMKELRSVLGGKNVTKSIRDYHGPAAAKVINGFLNDFARGGIDRSQALNFLDKWRSAFTGAVTTGNPTITIKQLTSIPAYAADMPMKDFNEGLKDFAKHPIKAVKTLMATDFMKARYDKGFERDLILAFRGTQEKGLAKAKGLKDFFGGFIKAGDAGAIVVGGWAAYKYAYDNAKAQGKSDADAKQIAEDFFVKTTERSQQAGNVKDLSFFQRGGSLAKLFTMFATSPLSYYRSVYGGIRNLKAGRGMKKENLKRIAIGQFVLPMLFQWVANGFRWDTEDELRAAILGPVNKLFMAGDFLEGFINSVTGADWFQRMLDEKESIPLLATSADINKIGKKGVEMFQKGEITTDDFLKISMDILETASKFPGTPVSGLPIAGLKRMGSGAWEATEGKTKYPLRRIMGFSRYALDEGPLPKKKDKITKKRTNNRLKGRF